MSGKKDLRKDDLDFLKELFGTRITKTISKAKKALPIAIKKPRITPPIRAYMDQTGQDAFDDMGEKTIEYEDWYQTIWPTLRTKTKRKVTVIEEDVEEVSAEASLAPLIRENTKALRMITDYLKSMDSSLQMLSRQPIKVEMVK